MRISDWSSDVCSSDLDHVFDDLLGYVEQTVQIRIDYRAPVFVAHFAEHAVARNAGVIDQNIDGTEFLFYLFESIFRGTPIRHIAHRSVERIAKRRLFVKPLFEVAARPAARHPRTAFLARKSVV